MTLREKIEAFKNRLDILTEVSRNMGSKSKAEIDLLDDIVIELEIILETSE